MVARNYLIIKDKKRRNFYKLWEKKKNVLKYKLHTADNFRKIRLAKRIFSSPRDSSKARIRNHCILTGKARSVYKYFRLSRHQLRSLAQSGDLIGVRRSSW
jgi:small subunit ribosomal protein S14